MAKTKKEIERELRIYQAMYEKAHKERMYYYYLLNDIANDFKTCAMNLITENITKDYLINTDIDKTVMLIAKKIKGE